MNTNSILPFADSLLPVEETYNTIVKRALGEEEFNKREEARQLRLANTTPPAFTWTTTKFLSKFTAIGTSNLRSLADQIEFAKAIIIGGGTLTLRRNNIINRVRHQIENTPRLLLFVGGCDATDDEKITIRPPGITNELLACFADLLTALSLIHI